MVDEALPGASFSTLLDVVEGMAGAAGSPAARLGAGVGALMRAVGATTGVVLHGGPDGMDVREVGPAVPRAGRPPAVRVLSGDQPLLDPIVAGRTEVTTAARALGEAVWALSPRRAAALESLGADQLLALPVRGGRDCVVVVLGRLGEDFTDAHLALLTALRPAVSALATLVEPPPPPEPDEVLRLTGRESDVLALLAQGHTAVRIGHLAGCSPRTVHHHLASIYVKLGVRDRLSAVVRARELGLVAPEPRLAPSGGG